MILKFMKKNDNKIFFLLEILANVEMLMDNPGPLGLKDESLMRYVQRVRSKQVISYIFFSSINFNL
jgi:hypothetical protein